MKNLFITHLLSATFLALFLTGCSIYRGSFDCPPGKGIGCASTSEVLDMIIENESDSKGPFDEGKNLFIPNPRRCQ